MPERLRVGVIGVGGIGFDHLASLRACPRATPVAIAETHAPRAKEACERFNVPRSYLDYRELLEQPDIDAVTIALPNHLHAPVASDALKARKHVLLEKPMATSARDAAKLVELARKMRRTLMVAQNFRFNRHTQAAKALITRGDCGQIYHARAFWLRQRGIPRIGSWFTQKQFAGGGCLADIGVHLLDTAMHLMDDFEVVSVSAQAHAKFGPRGLGEMDWGRSEIDAKRTFDVEDFGAALLKFKSGRSLALEVAWASFSPTDGREYGVDLLGTNAGVSLFPARVFRNTTDGYDILQPYQSKPAHSEDRIHHFVTCALDDRKPLVTPEESLKVQEILDAIYLSAKSGRETRLG